MVSEVTAIREGKGRKKRVNVFLDGRFGFSLETEVAAREGIRIGAELSAEQIEALTRTNRYYVCLGTAMNYLSYRPRSEFEVRTRLERRGFDRANIEAVLGKLKEQRLLDDENFARFWEENRDSFRPRSQRMVQLELKRKGVAHETIEQVTATIDDGEMAYRAAASKARTLRDSDYQTFRRRVGDFLRRRGFNYETINQTVKKLWQELTGGAGPDET